METWVWIVIAIIVVVAIVAAIMFSRRQSEHQLNQRREKADAMRTRGQEEDLRAKEHAAEAARQEAEAQRARMEADRLEREARERAEEADRSRAAAQSHLQDASRLDPGHTDLDPRTTDGAVDGRPGWSAADGGPRTVDEPPARRAENREF